MHTTNSEAAETDGNESGERHDAPPGGGRPRIVVVGVGNAGNTTVNRVQQSGISGAVTISVNTDKHHLEQVRADSRVLIGKKISKGLGSGGFPDLARKAALSARPTLARLLEGAELCIITAGATPVIAEIAREQGAVTLAMVSSPFAVEMRRQVNVQEGLATIIDAMDTACILDFNQIHARLPHIPLYQGYAFMDEIIAEFILSLCSATTESSLLPVSFTSLCEMVKGGGYATLCIGKINHTPDANSIVQACLGNPLLNPDCREAKQCLLLVAGGDDLSRELAETIAERFRDEVGREIPFLRGALQLQDFGKRIHCYALMMGLERKKFDTEGENRDN